MRPYRTTLSAALLLALLAGCASKQASTTASPAALGTTAPATAAAAPQQTGWVAIIDGKEVPCPNIPMGDDATVRRILDEGKNRNQVMNHLTYLAENIGPRLTGSSAVFEANKWCMRQYESWGLSNIHLDQWGTVGVGFDRGPSAGKLLVERTRVEPRRRRRDAESTPAAENRPAQKEVITIRDFELTTLAWTKGTEGPVRAPVVKMPKTEEELEKVQDKLKGAWVLIEAPPASGQRGIRDGVGARYQMRDRAREKAAKLEKGETKDGDEDIKLSVAEKVALIDVAGYISTSRDERVWTGAVPGWREKKLDTISKDVHVVVRGSDYDAINSRLADGEPVQCEFDLKHEFFDGPVPVYNTVAEIKGSVYPDEVIIVSAHLDSWNGPGSRGVTDNGTGSAVTLEAARILMAAKAKPHRTIRFIHWTGEEQGLLGSREYVKKNAESLDKISCCFVDDGGTNYQGGVGVATNQVELMAAATAPINNVFYDTTDGKFLNCDVKDTGKTIVSHGSSDHAAFNAKGVPGFYWAEVGRADYQYGWHTQHDKLNLAIPTYLEQSATNTAVVAYRLACAPTLVPRAEVTVGESPNAARARTEAERNDQPAPKTEEAKPAAPTQN
ncbi:MAG TPA: M20/M25/M40 family metallo-hydrolase [Phycisphaerales bacterium]|nr:M20/M25/M40 family metallo-hydrolase [Phycisphaerales bacterium]